MNQSTNQPITCTAPGKIILVGEHAVVYGQPAIAAPVWQTVATATISPGEAGEGLVLVAQDIDRLIHVAHAGEFDNHDDNDSERQVEPLAVVARQALARLNLPTLPDWRVTLTSRIPIASGLGSGAALCAALARALLTMGGQTPDPETISQIVYAGEVLYHGTPSGIDNSVVAHGRPIWFCKGKPPQPLAVQQPFRLVIGDSGIPGSTRTTVAHVRGLWQANPQRYNQIFDEIGHLVERTRRALAGGDVNALGPLLDANQALLAQLEVSTPHLDHLIHTARAAGAAGAKLSGGGGGGNIIALVQTEQANAVAEALMTAGARRVIITEVDGDADSL